MRQHTPGPWKHLRRRETDGSHDVMAGNPPHCVATCGRQSCDDGIIAANARLIAAAPDLLEACELIVAINDNPEQQSHPINLDPKAQEAIRAAIARATECRAIAKAQ